MATVLEVLEGARRLIEKPEDWAQGLDVRLGGMPTCAGVAIDRCADGHEDACRVFESAIGNPDIIEWNDAPDRTHAEVLAAFDKAIAAERRAAALSALAEIDADLIGDTETGSKS